MGPGFLLKVTQSSNLPESWARRSTGLGNYSLVCLVPQIEDRIPKVGAFAPTYL